jgi:hypothetical protein
MNLLTVKKDADMKRITILAVTLIFGIQSFLAQGKGKEVTITGEVVETQCYVTGMTGPGKGESHKECAITCAKNGIPLSILEDKTGALYLAGQTATAQSGANKMLIDYIPDKVKVTGRVFEKGGMKYLLVSKISRVSESK